MGEKMAKKRIAVPSIEEIEQAKEIDAPLSRFRRTLSSTLSSVSSASVVDQAIKQTDSIASSSATISPTSTGSPVASASSSATASINDEPQSSVPMAKTTSEGASSSSAEYSTNIPLVSVPSKSGSGQRPSALIINRRRQDGNPVLNYIRNIPYEWGETKADFDLGSGACCLYLSLKWHKLHPGYIETRFREIGHSYALQIVLAVVNVDEPRHILRELNMYCYNAGWTLILAYSVEEAAEYLESFKLTERKVGEIVSDAAKKVTKPPPKTVVDLAIDKDKKAMCDAAVNLLASIRSISRTDAQRLIGTFGSLRNIAEASVDQLSLCPGLGEQKAKRLYDTLRDPFVVNAPPKKSGRTKANDIAVE